MGAKKNELPQLNAPAAVLLISRINKKDRCYQKDQVSDFIGQSYGAGVKWRALVFFYIHFLHSILHRLIQLLL